jgi:uncharacterized protein YndB with AHSA1/START domain
MTPTETTAQAQAERISFEFDLHHSPRKVWRALTDPVLLTEWLLPVLELELAPGATFELRAPPQPGWDGIVHCRMLEIDAHRKLSYTWTVDAMDTVVTFELTPTASGTRLSLTHSGFKPDQRRNFAGARYGWRLMGGKLVALLERSDERIEI